jgi:hypothetical protein
LLRKVGNFILGRNRASAARSRTQLPDAMPAPVEPRRHAAETPVVVAVPARKQHTPASREYRSKAAAPRAVTKPAQPQPRAEQRTAPIAPKLHYQPGEFQVMNPVTDVPMKFGTIARHEDVSPSARQPLLGAEQVKEQLGQDMDLGPLQTVIHLPNAREPLYMFDQTTFDENMDPVPRLLLATPTALGKMRTHQDIGQPSKAEVDSEVRILEIPEGALSTSITIGTGAWLPGRANGKSPVPPEFQGLAARQTGIKLGKDGMQVYDLDATNPTVLEMNPQPIYASDPWHGGPIEGGQGAYVFDVPPEQRHNNPPHEPLDIT